uniref:Uncharacterized protein n=1 Tax=viral metagenome TaxID=1070528 RepID=A0A6C0H3Y2_9ZZZZ
MNPYIYFYLNIYLNLYIFKYKYIIFQYNIFIYI